MALASVTGSRSGRILCLGIGLFVVTGLLLATGNSGSTFAQTPSKGAGSSKVDPKGSGSGSQSGSGASKEIKIPDLPRVFSKEDPTTAEVVKVIDQKLEEAWKANSVQPADICSDHEYIRRVALDLVGRIAKPEEMRAFLDKPAAERRAWIVDEYLKSEDYPKYWATLWTNWLLTRSGGAFGRGRYHEQMHTWLEEQISLNVKQDVLVKSLIAAKGKSNENGAVTFVLAHVGEAIPQGQQAEFGQFEMVPVTARITRLFLGIQTQCTQCHDHPFDKRLQSEFWGVNAFLRQSIRIGNPGGRRGQMQEDLELKDSGNNKTGTVFFEKRNGVILETGAVFLDGKKPSPGASRREELAHFVVEHENFSKAYVNRIWAHFFARGFVNPIDDFNSKNEVAHPELFEELARQFKHYGYDQKHFIRWVCSSKAYNLKSVANPTNDKPEQEVLFSRMVLKAFSPEQLFESLMVATKAEPPKTKDEKEKRRSLRESWMNKLVTNFGDDEGNEVTFSGTVVQALLMMNGDDINKAIADKEGTVAHVVKKNGGNVRGCITDLYLHTLNRTPSTAEIDKIARALPLLPGTFKKESSPNHMWEDLMWALLNSNEFIFNH